MSKAGGWVPLDKGLIKALPKDRPFSHLEAVLDISCDYDELLCRPVMYYANRWKWSRGKVRTLLKSGIILLKKPVKERRQERWRRCGVTWKVTRFGIFSRDNFTCVYCGAKTNTPECDHVIPFSRGGSHEESNLATACRKCNRSKKDKTVEEWMGRK